ncbi:MAG: hypothetical protein M3Z30_05585, partial [Gemmatimonadota bacterium]|nr:hypothetical protein [Gemmatimonadota bacterium]
GNHWVSLPCVHPADGSIHAIGLLSQAHRGAIEFAGSADFENGEGEPLIRLDIESNGAPVELASSRMAWQRVLEWLPTWNATAGDLIVRGTVFAPCGRASDYPGFVYAVSLENRGSEPLGLKFSAHGTLGHRQHRVRTPRTFTDAHAAVVTDDVVTLSGSDAKSGLSLAVYGESMAARVEAGSDSAGSARFTLERELVLASGERADIAIYVAAAPESDGALAMVTGMRDRGWQTLASQTREALTALQQSTGVPAADRLINRHLMFAYFYGAGRAMDDARWYIFRSRIPWCEHGLTIRDYDGLMWLVPALLLAEPALARAILLRICELHGYAPGRGVNYMDGTPFDLSFCLDAAAAYPIAVDRYVAQTHDDRVVEELAIADALYAAHEDIAAAMHGSYPLYRTETAPSGAPAPLPYMLHSNALVAEALEILKQTLDEKTAESVQTADVVRAAILRQFADDRESSRSTLSTAIDLGGAVSTTDDPVGSAYWLPLYHLLSRDDSTYRRTVRRMQSAAADGATIALAERCASLMGPDAQTTLEWLRRAELDGGFAAEFLDATGGAVANGGDASLSALLAYAVWYAVTVLGVRPG